MFRADQLPRSLFPCGTTDYDRHRRRKLEQPVFQVPEAIPRPITSDFRNECTSQIELSLCLGPPIRRPRRTRSVVRALFLYIRETASREGSSAIPPHAASDPSLSPTSYRPEPSISRCYNHVRLPALPTHSYYRRSITGSGWTISQGSQAHGRPKRGQEGRNAE